MVRDQVNRGVRVVSGRNDILSQSYDRPEHPGRLRAVPSGVGVKDYYGKEVRPYVQDKYVNKLVEMNSFQTTIMADVLVEMGEGKPVSSEKLKRIKEYIEMNQKDELWSQLSQPSTKSQKQRKGGRGKKPNAQSATPSQTPAPKSNITPTHKSNEKAIMEPRTQSQVDNQCQMDVDVQVLFLKS